MKKIKAIRKKFEVGKFYYMYISLDHDIETWQCTKINNGRATFRLVGYTDSGKSYKITNDLDKRKVNFRIFEDSGNDSECISSKSKPFLMFACDEVKGE